MSGCDNAPLSGTERREIIACLRQLLAELTGLTRLEPEMPDIPRLRQNGCCFITLRTEGVLRGCIGNTAAFETLGRNLRRNVINAATADPVLPPLEAGEVEDVEIEVAILSTPQPVTDVETIIPGVAGTILRINGRSAVFLPQVAAGRDWSRKELLENLALKAGAAADDWHSPEAELLTFRTEVFSG